MVPRDKNVYGALATGGFLLATVLGFFRADSRSELVGCMVFQGCVAALLGLLLVKSVDFERVAYCRWGRRCAVLFTFAWWTVMSLINYDIFVTREAAATQKTRELRDAALRKSESVGDAQ